MLSCGDTVCLVHSCLSSRNGKGVLTVQKASLLSSQMKHLRISSLKTQAKIMHQKTVERCEVYISTCLSTESCLIFFLWRVTTFSFVSLIMKANVACLRRDDRQYFHIFWATPINHDQDLTLLVARLEAMYSLQHLACCTLKRVSRLIGNSSGNWTTVMEEMKVEVFPRQTYTIVFNIG